MATSSTRVCVKFPTGKNLCAQKQEAIKGTLYVNKITSNIPGKHRVTWFVNGKRVGSYTSWSGSSAELVLVGFDTATADTAVCACGDGGDVLHESRWASRAEGRPRHADGAAGGGRAGGRGGRGLGRRST